VRTLIDYSAGRQLALPVFLVATTFAKVKAAVKSVFAPNYAFAPALV
jgi:hypothetical protein